MKRIGYIDGRRIVGRNFVATSGFGEGLKVTQVYAPPTEGYGTFSGLWGQAQLAADKKFTGGVGWPAGVYGVMDFQDGAEVDQGTSIFAALHGAIVASGTPVFTDFGGIYGLYIANQCAIDLAGISAYAEFGSALASLQNHGGTLDHAVIIRGGNKITNVFSFESMGGGAIDAGTKAGAGTHMRILVDGVAKYINIYGG